MKGVIVCGGKGIRLRPLTYYFQKAMIPIGSEQKPVLEYVVRLFKYHNITDIVMLVNYKYQQILNYFNKGKRFGVSIKYVQDNPQFSGTAGALLNSYKLGIIEKNETLLIYYGDILSNLNLNDLLDYHKKEKAVATVALAKNYPIPVGVAEISNDGRIKRFIEKPRINKFVSIGILALDSTVFTYINQLPNEELDIMRDLIPKLIDANEIVFAYSTSAFWYDVGSLEKFEKLENSDVNRYLGYLLKR